MAEKGDQFRPGDVTFWGIVALVCGALAVLSANVSALIPDSVLAGLHSSRLGGADLNQLRGQVEGLKTQLTRVAEDQAVLRAQFAISEQAGGEASRRLAALEVSVPALLEALPPGADVDRSVITGSTAPPNATRFPAEGGSVNVTTRPLATQGLEAERPMPSAPTAVELPRDGAVGVALGQPVGPAGADEAWEDLTLKLGPLLLGLAPLLAEQQEPPAKRIVAGPLADQAQADALCVQIARVGIPCAAAAYTGEPLAQ